MGKSADRRTVAPRRGLAGHPLEVKCLEERGSARQKRRAAAKRKKGKRG